MACQNLEEYIHYNLFTNRIAFAGVPFFLHPITLTTLPAI